MGKAGKSRWSVWLIERESLSRWTVYDIWERIREFVRWSDMFCFPGEADRKISTKMPKHMFAGKRKMNKVSRRLPWSQRFFLIFLRKRDQQQAAKRRQRVAKATRRERKTSGYLGLESHFHADDRVRIWPSGVDWLIVFQTRKPIWLARLIVTTEGTLRIFTPHFASLY